MPTPKDFIREYGIDGEIIDGPHAANDDGWEHYAMEVRVRFKVAGESEPRVIDTPFKVGVGWDIGEFTGDSDLMPTDSLALVIGHFADSLRCVDMSWEEYAGEFHSEDADDLPVKVYRGWEAVIAHGRKVREWLASEAMVSDLASVVDE